MLSLSHQQPLLSHYHSARTCGAFPTTRSPRGQARQARGPVIPDRFIEAVETAAVLLLITFRPEFFPPWLDQPHVTMIQLNRLGRDQASAMIWDLAGKELPAEVLEPIISKTDGVPLFVEELTKM